MVTKVWLFMSIGVALIAIPCIDATYEVGIPARSTFKVYNLTIEYADATDGVSSYYGDSLPCDITVRDPSGFSVATQRLFAAPIMGIYSVHLEGTSNGSSVHVSVISRNGRIVAVTLKTDGSRNYKASVDAQLEPGASVTVQVAVATV